MNIYEYQNYRIEVFDDSDYNYGSADNKYNYGSHYFSETNSYYNTAHGIKIYGLANRGNLINNCILLASGGKTGIYENSAIMDGVHLLVCCSNTIFCLRVPDLQLVWKTEADWATCFEIFKFGERYLIRGEMVISCLDKSGNIIWEYGGRDIFVNFHGKKELVIKEDHLVLTDFNNEVYKVSFDGETLK